MAAMTLDNPRGQSDYPPIGSVVYVVDGIHEIPHGFFIPVFFTENGRSPGHVLTDIAKPYSGTLEGYAIRKNLIKNTQRRACDKNSVIRGVGEMQRPLRTAFAGKIAKRICAKEYTHASTHPIHRPQLAGAMGRIDHDTRPEIIIVVHVFREGAALANAVLHKLLNTAKLNAWLAMEFAP